jgi:hypothetical protein
MASGRIRTLRAGPLLLAVAAVFGAGCGWQARGPAAALHEPGTTTLRLVNHLDPPAEMDRLLVAVDGMPVPLTAIPPPGAAPIAITTLRLPPGDHTLSARAVAKRPGVAGDETMVVGTQLTFHVGAAPAGLTIDVFTGTGQEPIGVALGMQGGALAPELGDAPADNTTERCAPLRPVERALCQAAADLDDANRSRDVVRGLCIRDRLGEMRSLSLIAMGTQGAASPPAYDRPGRPEGDPAVLAAGKIARLSLEIDRCGGQVVVEDAVTPGGAPAF